jgi:hypothetical protein
MKKADKRYSAAEMGGEERVVDSAGRVWRIRVFPIGRLEKFYGALADMWVSPGAGAWAVFLQKALEAAEPGLWARARRALGLPEYSARTLSRMLTLKDAKELRDRVVEANLDIDYDGFAARCAELVKKKSGRAGKEAQETAERTGETSRERCS